MPLRRRALLVALVLGTPLLLGLVVLALLLPGVRADLRASRSALVAAQDDLRRGDVDDARRQLSVARARGSHADRRTHGALWDASAHAPVLGAGVREVQAMSRALAVTTADVLPPMLGWARPPRWSGRVDSAFFARLQQPLSRAQRQLATTRGHLARAPRSGWAALDGPRAQLEDGLRDLSGSVVEARTAAIVVPLMARGDHRYLVAVQNNAEPRATGGLLGSYAVLRVRDGAFAVTAAGPNQDLHDATTPVVALGQEYDDRFGRFRSTAVWRSANLTADTPTAGRILAGLWKRQFGQSLDGVVFVDPVALSDLLRATGPVRLGDGTRLTAANAVQLLLVDVYRRFVSQEGAARNAYLTEATREIVDRLRRPTAGAGRLVQAVATAAGTGHLQVWSSHPEVQRHLLPSRVGGALASRGPFLSVVTQDVGGSKLAAYLHREITYDGVPTGVAMDLGDGPRLEEDADVRITLRNAAPTGLPRYVTARPDDPGAPVGQAKYWISVFLGPGGSLLGATLDGRSLSMESATERGLPVFSTFVTLDRGQVRTLDLHVRQAAQPGEALTYREQPLVRPDALTVRRRGAPLLRTYRR